MKVITTYSVWEFDEDAMIVTRYPRNGEAAGKDHRDVSYQRIGRPERYKSIERGMFHGGDRIKVTVEDDAYYTGNILEVV